MPYPNYHAARVRDPDDFISDTFRTIELRPGVSLILGKLKSDGRDGPMTAQAYRFDKKKFTVDQAKKWLKKHKVKTILFEPAKEEEVKESSQIAKEIFNELCKTPGLKKRSQGKGRGLTRGKGKGPIGIPFGEVSTMANVAPNPKPSFQIVRRKKKEKEITDQKVVAVSPDGIYAMKGSYEDLREKIRKALIDSGNYGKYPDIVSTFPKKVFVSVDSPDGTKYFEVEWRLEGDEVRLGTSRELEKQIKFLVKEMAEDVKLLIFGRLEEKWSKAFINDLPDSSFAYIEPGGEKDEEWKTYPRYLRHFPVKDEKGNWDRAHVINALVRFRQINKKSSPWLTDEAKRKILSVIKAGYKALDMEFPELEEQKGVLDSQALINGLVIGSLKGVFEGGPGSGHWGHGGRPGMRGGSAPGGGVAYRVKGGMPKSLGAAALVDYGKYFTASGGLKVKEYKQLSDDMKIAVLKRGVESYKEKYIPKAQQGAMTAVQAEINRKIGEIEAIRRNALKKAEGLQGKELRGAYRIAVSLQQRANQLVGAGRESTARVAGAAMVAARTAEMQPRA